MVKGVGFMSNSFFKKLSKIAFYAYASMASNLAYCSLDYSTPFMPERVICPITLVSDVIDQYWDRVHSNIKNGSVKKRLLYLSGDEYFNFNGFNLYQTFLLSGEIILSNPNLLAPAFPIFKYEELWSLYRFDDILPNNLDDLKGFLFSEIPECIGDIRRYIINAKPIEVIATNMDIFYIRFAYVCGFAKFDYTEGWVVSEFSHFENIDLLMRQESYKNLWWRILMSVHTFVDDSLLEVEILKIMKRFYGYDYANEKLEILSKMDSIPGRPDYFYEDLAKMLKD